MKINIKTIIPHVVAIGVFLIFAALYFSPVWNGMQLRQSDVKQYQGAAKEITDYRMMNHEEALWTNGMFSGMPAYQISVVHQGNWMNHVASILRLGLPVPVGVLFVSMLGFYILGMCLRINPWIAMLGALAFGFASFNILYLGAGHITKVNAVSFMAPTLGGLLMATRGKWLWGSVVFAFFLSLNISANHFQITYYLLIMLGVIALGEGIRLLIEKKQKELLKIIPALMIAALVAVLPSSSNLLTTYEYAKYSTRGDSDITVVPKGTDKNAKAKSGLDKSYILEYNFGAGEGLSLFIPNAKGGAGEPIGNDEKAMGYVEDYNYSEQIAQSNHYWGGQLFSGGAIYLGAVAFFLFFVALFLIKDAIRFPVFVLAVLCMLLAAKTGSLNHWFIDHFPMYNKFRDSKMILVVLQVLVPMMAILFLDKLWKEESLQGEKKFHYGVIGGTVLIALILFAFPSVSGSFITAEEVKQFGEYAKQNPEQLGMIDGLKTELIHVREAIYKADAGRTLFFAFAAAILLLLAMNKVNRYLWLGLMGLLVVLDQVNVDLRYLNSDPIEEGSEVLEKYEEVSTGQIPYFPDKADQVILSKEAQQLPDFKSKMASVVATYRKEGLYADQPAEVMEMMAGFTALQLNSNYRVLTFENPFNETVSSYFHKSIGGYHGAKVKRYQQLVDFYLQDEMQKANSAISAIKMAKLQQYALTMQIPQEKAREVFDTISVSGGVMHDSCQILNMLNAKYIIVKRNDDPIPNPHANGNVWFVNQVNTVNSANKELLGLGKINTKKEAVMDINANSFKPDAFYQTDSADRIQMTSYKTKEIRYSSVSKHKGFAVFSEIYYPEGWVCSMDGKEVPYGRVNYVMRGMEIPAGKHEIVWQFKPNSFEAGTTYSMIGSLMLILSFLGVGALQFKNAPKEEEA